MTLRFEADQAGLGFELHTETICHGVPHPRGQRGHVAAIGQAFSSGVLPVEKMLG